MDNSKVNSGAVSDDEFISELQDKLVSQAGAVSSTDSNIQSAINEAIKSTRSGTAATNRQIQTQAFRERGYIQDDAKYQMSDFAESRTGFGTQMTAFRKLVETTDKNLNDLEMRKEELIMQNNAAGAAKITELQLQALDYKQKAMQQTFDNLLSVSSFGLQAKSFQEGKRQFDLNYELEGKKFQLSKDAQSFTEKQRISEIALEFGLDVNDGETIDTIVDRAAATGQVNERRQLELERIRAEIRNANAQAARAAKDMEKVGKFDEVTAEVFANMYRNGEIDLATLQGIVENQEQFTQVLGKSKEFNDAQKGSVEKIAQYSQDVTEFTNYLNRMKEGASQAAAARLEQYAAEVAASGVIGAKKGEAGKASVIEGLRKIVGNPNYFEARSFNDF